MKFLLASAFGFVLLQTLAQQSYTPQQANAIISGVISYVNAVNESGYIIFYPHLDGAYSYLSNATKLYNVSPDTAVAYALKAKELASVQLAKINSYKLISFFVVLAFTLVMLFLLYMYMRPLKARRMGRAFRH